MPKKKDELSSLVEELRAAGVKAQDLRKLKAASKTKGQSEATAKARERLAKAKKAKARYERSPEGLLGKVSKAVTKRKRRKK